MNPNLPWRRLKLVELLRYRTDDTFGIISGDTIRDDDDIERFDALDIVLLLLAFCKIRFQDLIELSTSRGAPTRPDGVEDPLHLIGFSDVFVARIILGIQEVDVDTVFIVRSADRGDGC